MSAEASGRLERLTPGQVVPYGGDRYAVVSDELAARFRAGDRLIVVHERGDLLHVPTAEHELVTSVVGRAVDAFDQLATCTDEQITEFFERFAAALDDDEVFADIATANERDVASAAERGRSTTRLVLGDRMRADMVDGLRTWRDAPAQRHAAIERIDHEHWSVEAWRSPLGVVGFVFEGRPNVFADAVGVLRTGNTVVFRIGSDALGTARAIVEGALRPSLEAAGLPVGAVGLVDSAAHAAGWALFSDARLALAVARGSGAAVAQLGAVARQAGVAVSLHGTGGAWMIACESAETERFAASVTASLDRKVCNTLNVCCVVESRAGDLVPAFFDAVDAAASARSTSARVHVEHATVRHVDPERLARRVTIRRADGDHDEPYASPIGADELGREWEWEQSPEVTLVVVPDVDAAVAAANTWSPRFVVSVITADPAEADRCWRALDAPFVGDAFTRWVDGQYALGVPELGLSNWESGRLLGRSAILSGASVHTVRHRAHVERPSLHR